MFLFLKKRLIEVVSNRSRKAIFENFVLTAVWTCPSTWEWRNFRVDTYVRPFLTIHRMAYKSHFCDLYTYISLNTTCMRCVFLTLTWTCAMQRTNYICTRCKNFEAGFHGRKCTMFYSAFCTMRTYRRPT